jgi:hypothetical protein
MFAGAGETITVLLAVTQVADTVCSQEDQQALHKETVVVECPQVALHQAHQVDVLVNTCQQVQPDGTAHTFTHPVLQLTCNTQVLHIVHPDTHIQVQETRLAAVINQAQLVSSQVFVGTVILAVTLLVALAQNVFTVVQFFWIVNVAVQIVGVQVKSQYFQDVATAFKSQVLA